MPFGEHPSYWEDDFLRKSPGCLDGQVIKRKLSQRGVYSNFRAYPAPSLKVLAAGTLNATGGGAATGATGDENRLLLGDEYFEYHILGTQTILFPQKAATGLDISMDQTDNDGVELTNGIVEGCRGAFKIGTDKAFYAKCKFSIVDVSGTDDCAFGFRKAADYTANIDDYTDFACLNVISGDIKIETALNNAATTTTDTTDNWADGETHTLEVYVSAAGVVTYQIDGEAPTTTAAFTFDDADVVVPFFYFLHATDVAGAVTLLEWEVDFQAAPAP
jgi:hypothetical protein